MDHWSQSFKLIHGTTPTKAEREHVLEAKTPNHLTDENEKPKREFKGSELKPPVSGGKASFLKINPKLRKVLSKPQQTPFTSPTKIVDSFKTPQSPLINHLLKTPSPRKLVRPTVACSNIHFLLEEHKGQEEPDCEEKEAEPVQLFEDELPEESLKAQKPKVSRKRPAPKSPQGNYVKANLKHRRFVKTKSSSNAKRFKRFKRKQ